MDDVYINFIMETLSRPGENGQLSVSIMGIHSLCIIGTYINERRRCIIGKKKTAKILSENRRMKKPLCELALAVDD